ncbi:MAG: hypothetical protein COW71_16080 [Ignavibacteriales bacterium CG18_big_fil_WC_8_21_14_2_50_31_20]|nr:MAG: hypothetical protein COW71_16080 [Ignavibacteriales bacterium CG18_big_fil_WC_8_21_14_2_50_31_20]
MKIVATLFFPILLFGQTINLKNDFTQKVDSAYINAMKGVYFAIENIPDRKNSVSSELIANNAIVASIKINKEIGGVNIQSIGYFKTYKVTVDVYRDYQSLKKEGIIDFIPKKE